MSLKDLLVTFVTSEEARVTPGAVLGTGSALSVILIAALLMVTLSPAPGQAAQCCRTGYPDCGCTFCCSGDCQTNAVRDDCPGLMCWMNYRWCNYGECEEQYLTCYGDCPVCTCSEVGDCSPSPSPCFP